MSFLTGILIGSFGGFLAGVILTCILLCRKNLEVYSKISEKTNNNIKAMQTVYKQTIDEYENGTPAPSYEDDVSESEHYDNDEYTETEE